MTGGLNPETLRGSPWESHFPSWKKTLKNSKSPEGDFMGFPGGSGSKELACNVGNPGSILGSGTFPGEGNGLPTRVFLAGEFPTEKPSRLQSIESQSQWSQT